MLPLKERSEMRTGNLRPAARRVSPAGGPELSRPYQSNHSYVRPRFTTYVEFPYEMATERHRLPEQANCTVRWRATPSRKTASVHLPILRKVRGVQAQIVGQTQECHIG